MEDLLNEISLLMSILTHIRLSGQRVHSRDSVSIVTYANLVLLSEMHESQPIIVMNLRTLSLGMRCLISSVQLQLVQSEKKRRQFESINFLHNILLTDQSLEIIQTCNKEDCTLYTVHAFDLMTISPTVRAVTHWPLCRERSWCWRLVVTSQHIAVQMRCHHAAQWEGSVALWVASHVGNLEVVCCLDCRETCIQWPHPFFAYILISNADRCQLTGLLFYY